MKKTKTCYLTELDVVRLEKHAAMPGADARWQDMLDALLMRAITVDARDIPANVVTIQLVPDGESRRINLLPSSAT